MCTILERLGYKQLWFNCSYSDNIFSLLGDTVSMPIKLNNLIRSASNGDKLVLQFLLRRFTMTMEKRGKTYKVTRCQDDSPNPRPPLAAKRKQLKA